MAIDQHNKRSINCKSAEAAMGLKSPKLRLLNCLIVSLLTYSDISPAVDVELLQSYNSTNAKAAIKYISDLEFLNDGSLVAADSSLGAVTTFSEGIANKVVIAGKAKAFSSRKVSGIDALPDGALAVTNSGDDTIIILDSAGEVSNKFGASGAGAGLLKSASSLAYSHNERIYLADEVGHISVFSLDGVFLYRIGRDNTNPARNLKIPKQVKLDKQERVYVLDSAEMGSIHIFTQAGKRLKTIKAAQLHATTGAKKIKLSAIAVSAQGQLFIADKISGKILQYDWHSNKVKRVFGSSGKGPGQYINTTALAVSDNFKIAVADSGNKKIDVYQLPSESLGKEDPAPYASIRFTGLAKLQCSNAYELNNGQLLCLDNKKNAVNILDNNGKVIKTLDSKLKNPIQASFDDQKIAVLGSKGVFVFNHAGTRIAQFSARGKKEGELKGAKDLFLTGKRIYVAESGLPRVQFFTQKGAFLGKLPRPGDSPNLLIKPTAVAVNSVGEIFVADNEKKKIVVFSANNQFMYDIGAPLKSPDAFTHFIDLAVDVDDNLYVLAGTNANKQSVHIYKGKQRIFRFANYSKKESSALQNATSLTLTPKQKTSIAIFDAKKGGMLNYHYIKVPAKVSGLKVTGDVNAAHLDWSKVAGQHIKGYRVFGALNVASDTYELIDTVQSTQLNISQKPNKAYAKYRVSAISGFDKQGIASASVEDIFLEAYQGYKNAEYDIAEKILSIAIGQNPQHAAAIKYLGLSYKKMGQNEAALSQFKSLANIDGFREEGLKLQVETLHEDQQFIEALVLVQQLIKQAPNDAETQLYCGQLSLEMNDAIGAVDCLEAAIKLQPEHIHSQLLLGRAYLKVGAKEQGFAQLEKALAGSIDVEGLTDKQRTDAALLWSEAGDIYVQFQEYELATTKYQHAISLQGENTQAQLGLANVYLLEEKYEEVRNIAIALAGNVDTLSEGNYLLGVVALANKDEGTALLSLGKSSRADANNVPAWIALAALYSQREEKERALQTLQTAATNNPQSHDAQLAYGRAAFINNNNDDAVSALTTALQIKPNDFSTHLAMAEAQAHSGALKQAEKHAQQAIRIQPKNIKPLLTKSKIQEQQGKTGDALESIRKAIAIDKTNATLHVRLATLYLHNSLYDQSLAAIEQALILNPKLATAFVTQGDLYIQRRLYEAAIESYEKAAEITPSVENKNLVNAAYAEKKKSEEFRFNQPQLVFENFNIHPIFSAAYKQYSNKPVGSIVVRNAAATSYGNLSLSFNVKGYMDFPTTTPINLISGGQSIELPLNAAFNNQVLDIDEDTGVQVEIKLNFVRNGQKDSISITRPMTIHGKNAITWSQPHMAGSFVTPKDDLLRGFVRQAINEYKPEHGPLSESLVSAMTLFNSFNALGIRYVVDPSNPFAELGEDTVDYVQFARETLKLKSGDCDDLSVLLSTSLENLGIATALLDVPGHLLMMFNTGIPERDRTVISQQESLVVIRDGFVWVPIEATMINTSFAEAWAEGARKYHKYLGENKLNAIALKDAWKDFQPVTLKHSGNDLTLPPKLAVQRLVNIEIDRLIEQGIDRIIQPYVLLLESDPENQVAKTQMAIVFAKYGLVQRALDTLSELLILNPRSAEAYNTKGNIYLNSGDFAQAVDAYQKAEDLDPEDGGIKINMSIAYYRGGELSSARNKYQQALQQHPDLSQRYASLGSLLVN